MSASRFLFYLNRQKKISINPCVTSVVPTANVLDASSHPFRRMCPSVTQPHPIEGSTLQLEQLITYQLFPPMPRVKASPLPHCPPPIPEKGCEFEASMHLLSPNDGLPTSHEANLTLVILLGNGCPRQEALAANSCTGP